MAAPGVALPGTQKAAVTINYHAQVVRPAALIAHFAGTPPAMVIFARRGMVAVDRTAVLANMMARGVIWFIKLLHADYLAAFGTGATGEKFIGGEGKKFDASCFDAFHWSILYLTQNKKR